MNKFQCLMTDMKLRWVLLAVLLYAMLAPAQNSVMRSELLPGVGAVLASGTTLDTPTARVHHVSGTSAVQTIPVTNVTAGDILVLIPDAVFTTITGGNIAIASTAVVDKALILTYDGTDWSPSY